MCVFFLFFFFLSLFVHRYLEHQTKIRGLESTLYHISNQVGQSAKFIQILLLEEQDTENYIPPTSFKMTWYAVHEP